VDFDTRGIITFCDSSHIKGGWDHMIKFSLCNTCRHYQPSLNPEGCFKEYGRTGLIGRFLIWIFGCEGYDMFVRRK